MVTRPLGLNAIAEPAAGHVSERTLEETLAYRLRQQELVSEFGLFSLRAHTLGDILQEATRLAASGMQARLCKLLRYRPEEHDMLMVAGIGWRAGEVGHATLGIDLESPAGYAFQTGLPVISNHLTSESRFRTPRLLADHGVKRALNVPIRDCQDPFGVLEVDSPDEGRFTLEDTAFLQGVANIVSAAIDRHRVEEELKASREETALLVEEQQHRVKNLFAVVGALVNLSTRDAEREGGDPVDLIRRRIEALSRASSISIGAANAASNLSDPVALTREILAPYLGSVDIAAQGVQLPADAITPMGLMLHEFATNAAKYGGLSQEGGCVQVDWSRHGTETVMRWREVAPQKPDAGQALTETGFGSRLISAMATQLGAEVRREWQGSGLVITVTVPDT